jgi:iron complex outermembrane receptor protein
MFRTALSRGLFTGPLMLALVSQAFAQERLPPIEVARARPTGKKETSAKPLNEDVITQKEIVRELPSSADTARLLRDAPGVSLYEAGGVSRLPALHGLADDRINILVGGVSATSACANHMNPPLSYIDPNNVESIEVLAGVTPVSKGGDSIAGTIIVEPKSPVFATAAPVLPAPAPGPLPRLWPFGQGLRFGPNGEVLATGSISSFFRSTNNGITVSGTANVATDHVSLLYNGSWTRGTDYHMGDNGPKVLSTGFISENHSATLAYQNDGHFLSIRGGIENIPYQGFPNQRMDMIKNRGYTVDAKYLGDYAWGSVDARAYWHGVSHTMGFLYDKLPAAMPMATEGQDFGYSFKAAIPFTQLSGQDLLRIGSEFHGQRLNDWWEPVPTSMMMRPFTYWNVANGKRDRFGYFAEWEAQWTPQWSSMLGARSDVVWMDTGNVSSYDPRARIPMGMMMFMGNPDALAAQVFNNRDRSRTDVNFDMTALVRYQPDASATYEAGYSRKTRSPNLYERYAWGVGSMAAAMVNWFGDGNGYIGNPDLKPEVAHTFSVTGAWRDTVDGNWEAKITPYFSYVENFIDADRLNSFGGVFQLLQFRNHKAELYGVDLSGRLKLAESPEFGRLTASTLISYVYGLNLDVGNVQYCAFGNVACNLTAAAFRQGDGLYHIMPLTARFGLEHKIGGWTNAVEVQLVDSKTHVNVNRNELQTPGYALVNLRSSYEWDNLRIDVGLDNVFDQRYFSPLGGFYFSDYKQTKNYGPLPGFGRNFTAGLTVKF